MGQAKGRNIAVSPFRRLVTDLMHFSAKVPTVTIDRRMQLAPLAAARQACASRPTWTALFTKAYGLVAARQPLLRRAYLPYPWPHFYEHYKNIATLNVERQVGDERVVLYALVRSPENRSLAELDEIIRGIKEKPIEQIDSYGNAVRLSLLPRPIRRMVFWTTLNWLGKSRTHNFGTFGLTTVGAHGAGILNLVPLLTSTIHYGLFDEGGNLDVRLAFDHRVLDGATAAEALAGLEATLLGEILDEVQSLRQIRFAA